MHSSEDETEEEEDDDDAISWIEKRARKQTIQSFDIFLVRGLTRFEGRELSQSFKYLNGEIGTQYRNRNLFSLKKSSQNFQTSSA